MAKAKGRAKAFQDPDEVITKDYDPEANGPESDHNSGSEASEDENLGTEHYVTVGKSKLREKEGVSLGPQYRGSRVSRSALDEDSHEEDEEDEDEEDDSDDDYDDPDAADLEVDEAEASDSEIESDNALGESDAERFKGFSFRGSSQAASSKSKSKAGKRATATDFMSGEEDESAEDEDMDDGLDALVNGGSDPGDLDSEEDDEDEEDDSDEDEDEDEDGDEEDEGSRKNSNARPNMPALSNRGDVDKGLAIQKQRKIYDGLLNLRIRLQKALVAANSFPMVENGADVETEPYEAAEVAAIKLLNTISSLRENFGSPAKVGEKRKRELLGSLSRSEEIWMQLQEEDKAVIGFREERLEKWSRKVQSVNMTRPNGISQQNRTLISTLQEQLTNPDNRLVKRTRVPRSCAPAQVAKKMTEAAQIYDDADFYQLLLKELVDQRTTEGGENQASAVPTVMLTASKEAKVRKQVDRKASKGRKMRFTVHEKLQNFMAPEDRRNWEQSAIDRFFGTLFGRKLELNEDDSEDDDMDGVDAEEEGLRLFRN